jgi:hypothetical protein
MLPHGLRSIAAPAAIDSPAMTAEADFEALRARKVPFSSRITFAAERQLKALAREGTTQTDLLAEALNLLFKKRGLKPLA